MPDPMPTKKSAAAMAAEILGLRRAIRKYGQHTFDCASNSSRDGHWLECDCGWESSPFNPKH